HRAVGADISASEVPADAVPGVGAGHITQERGHSKRPWTAARSSGAAGRKRSGGGGRHSALLSEGNVRKAVSRDWEVGEFPGRKTQHRYGGDRGTTGPGYIEGATGEETESSRADRQGV